VLLAIFLPIVRVRLAPLPRTLQAHLLVHRIGSDLLPMIIAAALVLACGGYRKPVVEDDKGQAERPADRTGNDDPSSGGSG